MATTDLKAVELRLRAILEPYREHLVESTIYSMPVLRRKSAKKHDWFAGVQPVPGAVKFNFLPMHENPGLLDGSSEDLRRHKTGASVFRFTEIDENLAGELEMVVAKGFLDYMKRDSRFRPGRHRGVTGRPLDPVAPGRPCEVGADLAGTFERR